MSKFTKMSQGHKFTLTKMQLSEENRIGNKPKIKFDSIVARGDGPLKKNVHGTKPRER